ncbi:hypothetical protein M8C21_009957 [Ambrosia artemisiifolia]|uniref:Uncharacterized protein n=1 Tax=Ambrosia artemisiifolia TaxID=4212 RepID=A0AAD5DE03_AMBAR|nr:hypothetical protein M8C21_009957 [Ambrosia artemisiifolia]
MFPVLVPSPMFPPSPLSLPTTSTAIVTDNPSITTVATHILHSAVETAFDHSLCMLYDFRLTIGHLHGVCSFDLLGPQRDKAGCGMRQVMPPVPFITTPHHRLSYGSFNLGTQLRYPNNSNPPHPPPTTLCQQQAPGGHVLDANHLNVIDNMLGKSENCWNNKLHSYVVRNR